jgi:hypothetical protein
MSTVEVGQDKDVAARNGARFITSLGAASMLSIFETTGFGLQVVGQKLQTLGRGSHGDGLESVLVNTHNVKGVNPRDKQYLVSNKTQVANTYR